LKKYKKYNKPTLSSNQANFDDKPQQTKEEKTKKYDIFHNDFPQQVAKSFFILSKNKLFFKN